MKKGIILGELANKLTFHAKSLGKCELVFIGTSNNGELVLGMKNEDGNESRLVINVFNEG